MNAMRGRESEKDGRDYREGGDSDGTGSLSSLRRGSAGTGAFEDAGSH